jgi:hemerythrin
MRILYTLVLFCALNSFSQEKLYIEIADGTKLKINSAKIDDDHKKIIYKVVGEAKETKARYEDIKTVAYADYIFRIFKIGKDYEGFFIMSESPTKILGFRNFTAVANRGGGFESSFEHIDVAILDKEGNLLERFDLRESKNKKNIETRKKTFEAVQTHFADCPKLLESIGKYYQPEKKLDRIRDYFGRLDNTISCK